MEMTFVNKSLECSVVHTVQCTYLVLLCSRIRITGAVPARQATVHRLAGRYDNPTQWRASSSSQGLRIGPQEINLPLKVEFPASPADSDER
jgi:hypothetical protein